jgi:hypothetical protein
VTSEQIKKKIYRDPDEALWEIAYQLAVQNERQADAAPSTLVAEFRRLRDRIEFLEATSEAYSEREARTPIIRPNFGHHSYLPPPYECGNVCVICNLLESDTIHWTANEIPPKPAPEVKK